MQLPRVSTLAWMLICTTIVLTSLIATEADSAQERYSRVRFVRRNGNFITVRRPMALRTQGRSMPVSDSRLGYSRYPGFLRRPTVVSQPYWNTPRGARTQFLKPLRRYPPALRSNSTISTPEATNSTAAMNSTETTSSTLATSSTVATSSTLAASSTSMPTTLAPPTTFGVNSTPAL